MTNPLIKKLAEEALRNRVPRARVAYAGMVYDEKEIEAAFESLYDSFTTGWFAFGKNCQLLEKRLATYLNVKETLLVNSGSSANLLIIGSLVAMGRLQPGDEILTPANTFPTTINALLLFGLKPVLVDVDLPSYTLSRETLLNSSSAKTKGVLLVHLNGSASFMPDIMTLAKLMNWVVIEDACDALGTTIDGKLAGTFGLAGSFSFYVAHHITMGEGGAICSNDEELMSTARSMSQWGRASGIIVPQSQGTREVDRLKTGTLPDDYEARYSFVTKGFNLKPIEVQAAIGLAQLDKLDAFTAKRRENFHQLRERLMHLRDKLILPAPLAEVDPSWWCFPLIVKEPGVRKHLTDFLESQGIETRPMLAGDIRKQPGFADVEFVVRAPLTNTEKILYDGFFVGVYPALNNRDLDQIAIAFGHFFRGSAAKVV